MANASTTQPIPLTSPAYSDLEIAILDWAREHILTENHLPLVELNRAIQAGSSVDELKFAIAILARENLLDDLHKYGTGHERPAVEITAKGLELLRRIVR